MLYDRFDTASASNLGGDDGAGVAAPTESSTQKTASHLTRLGRTACGDHAVRGTERDERAPGKEEVYSFGEIEGLQVLGVLLATQLVLGVLLAPHGRRELRGNRGCTSQDLAVHMEGDDVARVWGALG